MGSEREEKLTEVGVSADQCEVAFSQPADDTLELRLTGNWKIGNNIPSEMAVKERLESIHGLRILTFDTVGLTGWDSMLLTFLIKVDKLCDASGITVERDGLPKGVRRLVEISLAVPEREGARREGARIPFLVRVGNSTIDFFRSMIEMITFIGETTPALLRTFTGRAQFRRSDFLVTVQEVGIQALSIVGLVSFLVGLIFAFVGAIQLKAFGAEIYVADLVAIAVVREMGAIMTGIIMAGRTGAAFAAQLGTMQVNEEIDALRTLGISPIEFLVMPRMLALILMMPLLCLYADLVGILGGMFVGVTMLDLNAMEYYHQTHRAVGLNSLFIGLFMSVVFGVIVAMAGCLRGMQCGRSSSAVGSATTSAVVTGIVGILVATGIITVLADILSI